VTDRPAQPIGLIAVRSAEPFSDVLIDGAASWEHARRGLEAAGVCSAAFAVTQHDLDSVRGTLATAQQQVASVVLADAACPFASIDDIRRVVQGPRGGCRVGVRPVTDTVKIVSPDDMSVRGTLDRSTLRIVCAPLVLDVAVIPDVERTLGPGWLLAPLPELVAALPRPVGEVEVGPLATRVNDADELRVLAARR
jgi:2-C-methyl-D-erythritol 4-phosphate cytidylyltransferase